MTRPFASPQVQAAFNVPDPVARDGMLALRDLILETADGIAGIGRIEETLRWGQPAYLTSQSRCGTTLRIGLAKQARFALFVHCRTQIIPEFTRTFSGWDRVDGTRAVLFDTASQIDPFRHGWLVERALTYHKSPKRTHPAAIPDSD